MHCLVKGWRNFIALVFQIKNVTIEEGGKGKNLLGISIMNFIKHFKKKITENTKAKGKKMQRYSTVNKQRNYWCLVSAQYILETISQN